MPVVHDRDADSAIPRPRGGCERIGMTFASSPNTTADFPVHRIAGLHLRGRARPVRARVYWPPPPTPADPAPPLLVLYAPGESTGGGLDVLCRGLCSLARVVVLAVSILVASTERRLAAEDNALTILEWAADHATELDADPARLAIAGAGAANRLATTVAAHAGLQRWPVVAHPVLICPDPAELHDASSGAGRMLTDLAAALRHTLYDPTEGKRSTMSNDPITAEYTITKVFPVPRESVYQAWTDPAHFTHWFAPHGFTTPLSTISLDVRPRGEWRASLVSADGAEAVLFGTYRTVSPPDRLVFTTGNPEVAKGQPASIATVTLVEVDEGTEMTFHQAAVNTDEEHAVGAKAGWMQFFDRLGEHLAPSRRPATSA
jgi:uncharacterized protein YndB with AHSA1/START domain